MARLIQWTLFFLFLCISALAQPGRMSPLDQARRTAQYFRAAGPIAPYHLVSLSNIAATGDFAITTQTTGEPIGVALASAATDAPALIAVTGIVPCQFDGAATPGHLALGSSGLCHDASTTAPLTIPNVSFLAGVIGKAHPELGTNIFDVDFGIPTRHGGQISASQILNDKGWGPMLSSAAIGSTGKLTLTLADGTAVTASGAVAGAQGQTGLTGATGPKGDTGAQGPQGIAGPVGQTGPAGLQGVGGVAGPKGDTAAAGQAGPPGQQGTQGIVGPVGPAGPAGNNGLAGPQGAQGPVGNPGVAGSAGAVGAVGPAGPAGSAGLTGATGPPGVLFFNAAGAITSSKCWRGKITSAANGTFTQSIASASLTTLDFVSVSVAIPTGTAANTYTAYALNSSTATTINGVVTIPVVNVLGVLSVTLATSSQQLWLEACGT